MSWKITPGPWSFEEFSHETSGETFYWVDSDHQPGIQGICDLYHRSKEDALYGKLNAEANARAIAALPDLIEAAERGLDALTAETIGTVRMDDPDWYIKVSSAVDALRAALLKAKGGANG